MIRDDTVHATTRVAVAPSTAFEIFTLEVDAWWGQGPRFRPDVARKGVMRFEPGVGGRLLEIYDGREKDSFELARIKVWEPGARIVMDMGGRDFPAGRPEEWTEVEIRFLAEAGGTRVEVEHRGFRELGTDHPVYHGMNEQSFHDMMGLWWGDLLARITRHSAGRG